MVNLASSPVSVASTVIVPSSTATPVPAPSIPAAGFSAGALAGAVVASSIGLSLIAVLATYLYMQSRNRKHQQKDQTFLIENSDGQGSKASRLKNSAIAEPADGSSKRKLSRRSHKSSQRHSRVSTPAENTARTLPPEDITAGSMVRPGDTNPLQKFLPQSLADAEIYRKVFNVLDNIDIHVTNFYRTSSVVLLPEAATELSRLDSPYLPQPVAIMMQHSKNPKGIITHCLGRLIVSSISLSPDQAHNLLPHEFEILCGLDGNTKTDLDLAKFWLRMLMSYVRPNPSTDRSYISKRDRSISALEQTFSTAFAAWKNSKYSDSERIQNLIRIMEAAADVGMLLFQQPSTLVFRWRTPQDLEPQTIEKLPELIKVADEVGKSLEKPQIIVNGVIEKI